MRNRQRLFAVVVTAAALMGAAGAAMAHSGHDHGASEAAPPPAASAGPATAAVGEVFEVVVKADGAGGALLYVADLDSNAPVAGAVIEIDASGADSWQGVATPTASPGVYTLPKPLLPQPVDLTITISAEGRDDLLLAVGVRGAAPAATAAPASGTRLPDAWKRWLTGGSASLAALFGIGMMARRRGGLGLVVVLLSLVAAGSAFAHGGEDHGDGAALPAQPAPVPGRAVAMAKESQFLLGVRTAKVEARQVAETVRLVGRVVPDPAGYARVQPAQQGRLIADPDFPMPVPGQRVKRGDVLAVLEPNLTSLERSEQRAALFKVDTEIAQTERQLRRWAQMGDAARRKDVDDATLELERLRKAKAQIENIALGRDYLRAPIAGVVTDVHVVPGQVIGPETTAIEVVDPERLRVEAVLHDLALAEAITGGQATTKLLKDRVFDLKLIGSGGRIDPQDQGLHLIFAVTDGARFLRLGMPLDVHAHTGAASLRVAVPRDSVADAGGRPLVFVKMAPESFEARPVKLGRTLGDWSEIETGVAPGERVVVQGAMQLLATR